RERHERRVPPRRAAPVARRASWSPRSIGSVVGGAHLRAVVDAGGIRLARDDRGRRSSAAHHRGGRGARMTADIDASPPPASRPLSVLQIVSTGARVGVSGVVSLLARGLRERGAAVRIVCITDGPLIGELAGYGIPGDVIPVRRVFDPAAMVALRRYMTTHR